MMSSRRTNERGSTSSTSSSSSSLLPARMLSWLLFVAIALTIQLLWNLRLADALAKAAYLNTINVENYGATLLLASSLGTKTKSSSSSSDATTLHELQKFVAEGGGGAPPRFSFGGSPEGGIVNNRSLLSLDELTISTSDTPSNNSTTCPMSDRGRLVYIENEPPFHIGGEDERPLLLLSSSSPRSIPPILHQTSKSRCVTRWFANGVAKWKAYNNNNNNATQTFAYYFHDDDAIYRLFESVYDEFPFLEMVVTNCVPSGAVLSDLWRYVVLWKYGGIYADLDSIPGPEFDPTRIFAPDDADAIFVVEYIGLLSQYFIAVSPNHPIMWYAIQHTIHNLLMANDIGTLHAPTATGPYALHEALRSFRADGGTRMPPILVDGMPPAKPVRPVKAMTYVGTNNRTVTAIGTWENSDAFVQREIMARMRKQNQYGRMNMTHFSDAQKVPAGRSCLSALFEGYWKAERA